MNNNENVLKMMKFASKKSGEHIWNARANFNNEG